jgi:hypothetical protein
LKPFHAIEPEVEIKSSLRGAPNMGELESSCLIFSFQASTLKPKAL